jgi:hypothetical protein
MAPTAMLPMIDISNTGIFIAPILLDPAKYNGKSFTCATEFLTPLQLIEGWTNITGKAITYSMIHPEDMALPLEMVADMKKGADQMNIYSYFGPTGPADLEWTQVQLKDKLTTWEEFVKANEPWFKVV